MHTNVKPNLQLHTSYIYASLIEFELVNASFKNLEKVNFHSELLNDLQLNNMHSIVAYHNLFDCNKKSIYVRFTFLQVTSHVALHVNFSKARVFSIQGSHKSLASFFPFISFFNFLHCLLFLKILLVTIHIHLVASSLQYEQKMRFHKNEQRTPKC